MTDRVHFKTNILLKNIIGKDLITDDNVAILELVKNSYDAGSKLVNIIFENVNDNNDSLVEMPDSHSSKIVICDKGCGMDYNGLINKWLNIAYSEKKERSNQNGRRQAGNKGVGRFSCDRLGKVLTIFTKMEGKPCLKMTIDWRLFEDENAQNEEIQDIEFAVQEATLGEVSLITGWNEFESGTVLNIGFLRSQWTVDKILKLRRDLEKFIDPNSSFSTESFQINLKADDYREHDAAQISPTERVNGPVENMIFENLDFRTTSIASQIDSTGDFILTTLQDRGRIVFEVKEVNPYSHLRNVKMTVYYLNPYSKRYFRMQTGFSSADFGSIFLFINGFRIPPYGDQGDDWLGIEKRKSLGFRRYLSTREIVGRVEIDDENGDFMTITSRTGVVNNDAFEELSRSGTPYGFFFKGFRRLERFVVEGIAWDKAAERVTEDGKGEEKYLLDDLSRDMRILSVIRRILDIDDSAIEYLHIDEEFVRSIMDAQMENAAASIQEMVEGLSQLTDNATPEVLDVYKSKLEVNKEKLDNLIMLVGKLAPEQTDISRLVHFQEEIDNKQRELENKEIELAKEIIEKEELARKLALEKEKNTYLLTSNRSLSEDAKGMVHTIKIIADKLHSVALNTYNDIQQGTATDSEILLSLGRIVFQSDKALKISKLITRANFNSESENKDVDVVAYISQYLDIYKDIVDDSHVDLIKKLNNIKFIKKIGILDVAVILDNLISNSEKAGATQVQVETRLSIDNNLILTVSDNGRGLDPLFKNIEDSIFDLGVTTTDGSGIGLNTVKTVVQGWSGTVQYVGEGLNGKGATIEITIPA